MATEKRLIDANALIEQFDESNFKGFVMKRLIEMQPTVDAVEVVRCKDCKHYVAPQGVPCCDCFYGLGFPNKSGNDFCSYGERRGDHGSSVSSI